MSKPCGKIEEPGHMEIEQEVTTGIDNLQLTDKGVESESSASEFERLPKVVEIEGPLKFGIGLSFDSPDLKGSLSSPGACTLTWTSPSV